MLQFKRIVYPMSVYMGSVDAMRSAQDPIHSAGVQVTNKVRRSFIRPCYNPNDGQGPAMHRMSFGTITLNK